MERELESLKLGILWPTEWIKETNNQTINIWDKMFEYGKYCREQGRKTGICEALKLAAESGVCEYDSHATSENGEPTYSINYKSITSLEDELINKKI